MAAIVLVIWRKFICSKKNEDNTQKHSQEIRDGKSDTDKVEGRDGRERWKGEREERTLLGP